MTMQKEKEKTSNSIRDQRKVKLVNWHQIKLHKSIEYVLRQ